MSQTPFEATFAGWDDNSFFNGPLGSCTTFTVESLTSGPTATPSVGSSLNQYHHGDCNEQAAVSTPSATTQPATTQPETTQPTTTQPVTTQPTTTQPVTTQPATTQPETTQPATTQPETTQPTTTQPVTMQPTTTHSTTTQPITTQSATTSRGTTVAVEGRCETFKIGATLENCHPRVSLCSNPDFNSSAITVVSATLRVSEASPVDITRLAQNIIACSQPACEGALYEVIQMYSRVECLSAVDGPKTISIEIEYTYESFTFSIQTNSLFTIDEDGLHSEHCDNLYYESRPNMTSNSVEYPFNCSLLDESRYGESSSASTPGSTVEKRGCPPMTKGFVAGTSLGFESCGATFIIVSDSLDMADGKWNHLTERKDDGLVVEPPSHQTSSHYVLQPS
ncbi:location of vulva defective 1-like [Strongylocentrotus purpuratus]|uniref:Uncharacterized protein n=1 Tax=Strongylocentrotus purpuratus TaxID=7668 RepID=A0A7M7NRQ7_STRPU|nr:location of vulva defective 1-like [Strongylocentrotus purpuratus]